MGGRDSSGTDIPAISESMATECAGFTRDHSQAFGAGVVARIDDEIEGPVQGHGAEVTGIEGDEGAGRIAAAAIDALGLMIELTPFAAFVRQGVEAVRVK